jgi:CcmD family protein
MRMMRVTRVMHMMRVMQVMRACTVIAVLAAAPALSAAEGLQPQPPKEFVPVDEVPQGEQIPAINLVAAAYGFVWVATLGYVWSIARRQKAVEAELAELESRRR